MIRQVVEKVAQALKHDNNYRLDPALTGRALFQVASHRARAVINGRWRRLWLREAKGALFLGKAVSLQYPQYISVGRSVIIEDYVRIDALSQQGVVLGDNVTIAKFTTIQCTGVIRSLGIGLRVGNN